MIDALITAYGLWSVTRKGEKGKSERLPFAALKPAGFTRVAVVLMCIGAL